MLRKFTLFAVTLLAVSLFGIAEVWSKTTYQPEEQGQPVDLVIALDVSGSMSGLIESAKQRLWDVVNELAQAQPQPDLRLAILTYGNPAYGAGTGYVNVDMPFTRDLDAVMQTLFSFGTNGGDEYVSRAVTTSVSSLDWSVRRHHLAGGLGKALLEHCYRARWAKPVPDSRVVRFSARGEARFREMLIAMS